MVYNLADVLNKLNEMGFFSYVFPFTLIFSIVFGLLQKIKVFGDPDETKGINIIIAVSVGLLSLSNDYVSTFFATIFPKLGIAMGVFLILVIFLGFFLVGSDGTVPDNIKWIGWILGLGVVVWAFSEWGDKFRGIFGIGDMGSVLIEYLPLISVFGLIIWVVFSAGGRKQKRGWEEERGSFSH